MKADRIRGITSNYICFDDFSIWPEPTRLPEPDPKIFGAFNCILKENPSLWWNIWRGNFKATGHRVDNHNNWSRWSDLAAVAEEVLLETVQK
jgi:hypothetical protein